MDRISSLFITACALCVICLHYQADASSVTAPMPEPGVALYEGKSALDANQFDRAITLLSRARENLPLLADYALYWRAKAYLASGDTERASADIRTVRELAKKSILAKPVRLLELDLARHQQSESIADLYQRFMKDYPSDMQVKLAYAIHLKNTGASERAIKMLRELFTTVSSAASAAQTELDPDDITAEDLLKKAKNLNSGWLFADAERVFREALHKNGRLRASALDGLAYSLFRQKRYREAANTYAETGNTYWRARSLLRANDLDAFSREVNALLKSRESRNGSLLLAYASKQRRSGNLETAFKTYQRVAGSYQSEREEALWLTGWTHYRQKEFAKALEIFSQLHVRYGGLKYVYWMNRSAEKTADAESPFVPEASLGTRDYYGYMTAVRLGKEFPGVTSLSPALRVLRAERADLLAALGFRREASLELKQLADKSSSHDSLIAISEQFRRVGDYKNSLQTALRVPYTSAIHDLHYPRSYRQDIEEAAIKNGLDPNLLLAVMREESRFDSEARSIAGALGLMQLMPQTAQRIARRISYPLDRPESLYLPKTNIMIGAAYLKTLMTEFGGIPYAIAAYNAGEEAVREWVQQGRYATVDEFVEDIPYYETQNYVKKVLTSYFQYLRVQNVTTTGTIQRSLGRL